MRPVRWGVWAWGGITVVLALTSLVFIVYAGWHIIDPVNGTFDPGFSQRLSGVFFALKENGNLVAGILGFSGLAWSHFFKAHASSPALKEGQREDSYSINQSK